MLSRNLIYPLLCDGAFSYSTKMLKKDIIKADTDPNENLTHN